MPIGLTMVYGKQIIFEIYIGTYIRWVWEEGAKNPKIQQRVVAQIGIRLQYRNFYGRYKYGFFYDEDYGDFNPSMTVSFGYNILPYLSKRKK